MAELVEVNWKMKRNTTHCLLFSCLLVAGVAALTSCGRPGSPNGAGGTTGSSNSATFTVGGAITGLGHDSQASNLP